MNTYGCTPGTFVAQKAPCRFPSRGGASIQFSSKKREMIYPTSPEKSENASRTSCFASGQSICVVSSASGAIRS